MDERAGRLNQPFEEVCIGRIRFEPKLLENIVRLIITLLVPALKKSAIKRMLCQVRLVWIDLFNRQLRYQPRNPLAFVHEGVELGRGSDNEQTNTYQFRSGNTPRMPGM